MGNLQQAIHELCAASLSGIDLEEKEEVILQELRINDGVGELEELIGALSTYGTILAVPALLAVAENNADQVRPLAQCAVLEIRDRARKRVSLLPDEYFTLEHWQPEWKGSKNGFLSYVSALANIHLKQADDVAEVNRIGEILLKEMKIDISPYDTFDAYRICAVDWDFQEDYKVILDRIEQESVMAAVQEAGIEESFSTFIMDNLMDLQYDYLLTRLRMGGNMEYHKFVMKIAECLNQPSD